jgi:circadian clock protein KaiB
MAESNSANKLILHLYIVNKDFKSVQAIKNVKEICEESFPKRYKLDIIDILKQPALARENQIMAAPTLIKESPLPLKRLVGNMSDRVRVSSGLELHS